VGATPVMRRAAPTPLVRVSADRTRTDQDLLAVEAPLLLRVTDDRRSIVVPLGVLLRTPGDDEDLVRGLLFTEGIIRDADELLTLSLRREAAAEGAEGEIADVTLASSVDLPAIAGTRALPLTTSACGLCGRLEPTRLPAAAAVPGTAATWAASTIAGLPDRLRAGQTVFRETGGLHAAAIVDADGTPIVLREDIGRHNAVDKVVGAALAARIVPDRRLLVVVSGRVAYEIVQKTAVAGLGGVVAVGAPSNLAVEAARRAGLVLVGFVRDGRFNVYHGADRVQASGPLQ
jgi:FdhD protein